MPSSTLLQRGAPIVPFERRVLDLFSYGGTHYDRTLLLRLHELQDVVDEHVIVDMGMPLSLNKQYVQKRGIVQRWNSSQPCWHGWLDRIRHVPLDGRHLLAHARSPAKAQQIMRTAGFSFALEQALPPGSAEAWVLLSDIDEIPRASALSNALLSAAVRADLLHGRTHALAGRSYYYNAACVTQRGSLEDHWIAGPKLLASERLRNTSWQDLRTYFIEKARKHREKILWNASWHFGFLMTPQEQLTKLCLNVASVNHQICVHRNALAIIVRATTRCQDLWNRSIVPLVREEHSVELPIFVQRHYAEFRQPATSIHDGLCNAPSVLPSWPAVAGPKHNSR